MKRIVLSICLLMAFVCLTSFPANAGMELTIINGTSMELNKLTMEAEEGNMTVSVNIVPNNKVTLSDGNTSTVTGLKVIIGDQCYQFENMKLLGPEQNIKFALQNDGIPILQPQGETSDNSQAAITGTVTSLISKESPADLAQVLEIGRAHV